MRLIGAVVCVLAAPHVHMSVSMANEWSHFSAAVPLAPGCQLPDSQPSLPRIYITPSHGMSTLLRNYTEF